MVISNSEYLTVQEAAQTMRVSASTVWRWIRSGQLRAYRVGARSVRIKRSELEGTSRPIENAEERRDYARELIERLSADDDAILARRGGKLLPSSVDAINQAREERYEDL